MSSSTQNNKALRGMESFEGILRSAAILSGLWMAYKLVSQLKESAGGAHEAIGEFFDEQARASKARDKAERDTSDTMREQNKRDTQRIRQDIQRDQIERERRKLPKVPLNAKGRWEGNVFIPEARTKKP